MISIQRTKKSIHSAMDIRYKTCRSLENKLSVGALQPSGNSCLSGFLFLDTESTSEADRREQANPGNSRSTDAQGTDRL